MSVMCMLLSSPDVSSIECTVRNDLLRTTVYVTRVLDLAFEYYSNTVALLIEEMQTAQNVWLSAGVLLTRAALG